MNIVRINDNKPKENAVGLVLEGGAMRGLFTSGILDVFMEAGLEFDGAIGVSAGVAFGCNYKSKQPGRVLRYNRRFSKDWRYRSFRSLIVTGDLYGGDFCYHTLPDELDLWDKETFKSNPMDFWCVATDVNTGEPVYKQIGRADYDELEWVRASASMPLASKVVNVDGYSLLDGGVTDSIPLKKFQELGYKRNVVILTQPDTYIKHGYKFMPFIKAALHKYPKLIKALEDRPQMYNGQTAYVREQEQLPDTLVIRPPEALNVSALESNVDELQRVYDIGRQTGLKYLSEVKNFLNQ